MPPPFIRWLLVVVLIDYASGEWRHKRDDHRVYKSRLGSGQTKGLARQRLAEDDNHLEEDALGSARVPDSFHVVSSALRVVRKRRKRNADPEWRNPREYQFVTRGERDRLPRYYDDPRDYRPRNNKRIIYYATLPEVTRRPEYEPYPYTDYRDYSRPYYPDYHSSQYQERPQYYDRYNNNPYYRPPPPPPPPSAPAQPQYPGYPPVRDNEIRVQSSVIDVTSNKYQKPQDPGITKFTIIDAEPPYRRPPPYDNRYDTQSQFYNRPRPFEYPTSSGVPSTKPPPRKEMHIPIPPAPLTVYRRPLDVRPLDPVRDLTSTTAKPTSSPSTTTERGSPGPSTLNPIQKFERTFKF